jgi:hypothetical protein
MLAELRLARIAFELLWQMTCNERSRVQINVFTQVFSEYTLTHSPILPLRNICNNLYEVWPRITLPPRNVHGNFLHKDMIY